MKLVFLFGLVVGYLAFPVPPASGVDLIIKSRIVSSGDTAILPVSVRTLSSQQLWGIDFALFVKQDSDGTDGPVAQFPARGEAFIPAETPKNRDFNGVMRKGFLKPNDGYEKPDLYVCMVNYGGFANNVLLGRLNLEVVGNAPRGTVVDLTVRDYTTVLYSDTNPLTPYCTKIRPGASAALARNVKETGAESAPVVFCNRLPADLQPTDPGRCIPVPLHKIAIGAPGDVNGDGRISSADIAIINGILSGRRTANTDYELIAADVAPGAIKGTNGDSGDFGDGWITKADVDQIQKMALRQAVNLKHEGR